MDRSRSPHRRSLVVSRLGPIANRSPLIFRPYGAGRARWRCIVADRRSPSRCFSYPRSLVVSRLGPVANRSPLIFRPYGAGRVRCRCIVADGRSPSRCLSYPRPGSPLHCPSRRKDGAGSCRHHRSRLDKGASRDPRVAVRPSDGLSGRKGGRGESTGPATPGEPRPPLPSKGIPRDMRG